MAHARVKDSDTLPKVEVSSGDPLQPARAVPKTTVRQSLAFAIRTSFERRLPALARAVKYCRQPGPKDHKSGRFGDGKPETSESSCDLASFAELCP